MATLPEESGINSVEELSKTEWYAGVIVNLAEQLNAVGKNCKVVKLPDGVYSYALVLDKETKTSDEPLIRVLRTIFTTQDNFIGDIFNQCGYAFRTCGQSNLVAPAESNVDRDKDLELLIDQFLEKPSLKSLTQICDLKKERAVDEKEKTSLEKELELVENMILSGDTILDAVEMLVTLHPFSVSESGLSPSLSISFANSNTSPLNPAVSGVELEGEKLIGLTLVIDVAPERLDFSDVWQGAVQKKIMPDEISAILISSTGSPKKDNHEAALEKIPGSVMKKTEQNFVLQRIRASRMKHINSESDLLQAKENRRSRNR